MNNPTAPPATTGARVVIDGVTYNSSALDQISLKDLLIFDQQVADALGSNEGRRWSDVERVTRAIDEIMRDKSLTKQQKNDTVNDIEGAYLFTAAMLWVTLRNNGQPVTFDEAISRPISSFTFLPPTEDKKTPGPTKRAAAKKAPAKKTASGNPARRRASAAAGESASPE